MEHYRKKYDFFISHASEDKEIFVRPLANELIKMGFKVWFDETTLKLGDSLFEEISKGIKESTFGIVVLSRHFLNKQWTKKELNGLISKEVLTSDKVILPVWLDITVKEVFEFSPIMTDKVSVFVKANEIDKVIAYLLAVTKAEVISLDMVKEKIKYLQNCSEVERKKYIIDTESRIKNLVHFQEAYYNWFCSDEAFGDDEWDNLIDDKRRHEFLSIYNLPYNVTYNSEFHPGRDMNLIIKLAKKLIEQKASMSEIYELIFLVDWYHELDLPYILLNFSQDSLENEATYDLCFLGLFYTKSLKKSTQSQIKIAMENVFYKYHNCKTSAGFDYILDQTRHDFILDRISHFISSFN